MLFNSLAFFALLTPTLGLYWIITNQTARLWLLLIASFIFYGFYHWPSVFLLIFTILFNYKIGGLQSNFQSRSLLIFAITGNLSILLWFKYASFVAENINKVFLLAGISLNIPTPPSLLPLGISFFTFQVIAYQVDIFRKNIRPELSLPRFAVFKCFFPQLIAGPIVAAKDFLPQLVKPSRFNARLVHQGIWLVIAGLGLKIGVADVLAQFADEAFRDTKNLTTISAWTGLYAYSFQLYADFWGYSTMAVGLASLFGLKLPLNFDSPYFSESLQDFWRRWHITLSTWFRDYVYIPLGGNRQHRDFNLLATMTLAGLWHGAGWPFIIWGFGHGLWLVAERHITIFPPTRKPVFAIIKAALVFHGVCLLWVLFRAPDLSVAFNYFQKLFGLPFTYSKPPSALLNWVLAFGLIQWPLSKTFKEFNFCNLSLKLQLFLVFVSLYFILAYAGAKVDFVYFNF